MYAIRSYYAAWIQSGSATEPVYFKKNQHILSEQWRKAVFFPEQVRQQMGEFLQRTLPIERAGLYQALLIGSLVNIPADTLEA